MASALDKEFKIDLRNKLINYIEKFKNLPEEYGNRIDVESFSIDVRILLGISISFTFKPKEASWLTWLISKETQG